MQFNVHEDLCIGKVVEVNGTSIKIELDSKLTSLTRAFQGSVYSIGQMASIVKIHFGRIILFASVRMLRMKSEIDLDNTAISLGDDARILEADLLGEGRWNKSEQYLNFSRGVETYPLPLQPVYLMTNDEVNSLYKGAEESRVSESSPAIKIGTYAGTNQACRADINKLFGNHCAILGSTGSGKSGTVAAILRSVLEHLDSNLHPRIIMIDPHGEYGKAFTDRSTVYKAYGDSNSESDDEIKLPYWLMTSDEFRSLVIGKTEFEATAQNNIVYDALSYARMIHAGIIEPLSENPNGGEIPNLCAEKTEEDRLNFDRDKPIPFKLKDFILHIDKVQGRKPNSSAELAPSDSQRKRINDILTKLKIIRSNPQLKFILKEYDTSSFSLSDVISQLIGNDKNIELKQNLKIIDISGLPNEVAGLLTALIARLVFQYKIRQSREQREKDPVLLVCEEAHRYVPNHGEAQYKEAQNAIRRIAKEGRKYGLGLMLISQRPDDVEKTVLSQCSSWIIMRLTNSTDQNYVSSFIPDNLAGLTRLLPSLKRREAIFVGEAAAIPSRIKVLKLNPEQLPDSEDIDFVKGWSTPPLSLDSIKDITEQWVGIKE